MLHKILKNKIINYTTDVGKNGVYLIYHIHNSKKVYIGSTDRKYRKKKCRNGCYARWIEHYHRLRKKTHHSIHLQRAVDKYGIEGLRFKLLVLEEEKVRILEKFYIDKFNSFKKGYNCSNTTTHPSMSKETKLKLSIRMKNNNPMKREEIKKKVSEARKKLYPASEVLQYTKVGEFIKLYKSIEEVSKKLKVDSSNIYRAISGETKSCVGYIWLYKHEFSEKYLKLKLNYLNTKYKQSKETINKRVNSQKKKVIQLDLDNNILNSFDSAKEAGEITGVHPSNITRCCKGETKTCKGFKWKYTPT